MVRIYFDGATVRVGFYSEKWPSVVAQKVAQIKREVLHGKDADSTT